VVHAKEGEEQGEDATNDDDFVLVASTLVVGATGGTNHCHNHHRWSTATRIVSDDDVILMGNTQPSNSILQSHDDPTCHYHHPGTIHQGDLDNRLGDTTRMIQYQRYGVEEKHHNNHPERWYEEIWEESDLSLSLDHHNRIRNPTTTTAVEEYDTPVSPTLRPVHPSRILQELVLHSHQQLLPQEPPGPEQPHSHESPERQEQQQQQQMPQEQEQEQPEPEPEPEPHEQQDQPQPEQEEPEQPYQLPPIMEHRVWIDEDEILNRRIDDDDDDENINNNTNNNILELDSFELFDML
jgi:hypothetical protein